MIVAMINERVQDLGAACLEPLDAMIGAARSQNRPLVQGEAVEEVRRRY